MPFGRKDRGIQSNKSAGPAVRTNGFTTTTMGLTTIVEYNNRAYGGRGAENEGIHLLGSFGRKKTDLLSWGNCAREHPEYDSKLEDYFVPT